MGRKIQSVAKMGRKVGEKKKYLKKKKIFQNILSNFFFFLKIQYFFFLSLGEKHEKNIGHKIKSVAKMGRKVGKSINI